MGLYVCVVGIELVVVCCIVDDLGVVVDVVDGYYYMIGNVDQVVYLQVGDGLVVYCFVVFVVEWQVVQCWIDCLCIGIVWQQYVEVVVDFGDEIVVVVGVVVVVLVVVFVQEFEGLLQ